jgi:MFS family permease
MPVLIGMRCLQAIGSSAVISVGAGSLADMYEVHERGQKVSQFVFYLGFEQRDNGVSADEQLGLFYGMPLLGPALGPLIGGALGNVGRYLFGRG